MFALATLSASRQPPEVGLLAASLFSTLPAPPAVAGGTEQQTLSQRGAWVYGTDRGHVWGLSLSPGATRILWGSSDDFGQLNWFVGRWWATGRQEQKGGGRGKEAGAGKPGHFSVVLWCVAANRVVSQRKGSFSDPRVDCPCREQLSLKAFSPCPPGRAPLKAGHS